MTVTPVNDAPVASNGSLTTNEDTAFGGTLPVATDVDGDALTYAAGGTAPSHGTVVVNGDGTFTYTPAVGYNGLDSFTYTVSDGTVSVERTMTVTVTPVNDAPVASNGSLTTNEDTAFGGTLPVASDVDGDALTYAAGGTAPSHGTVVVNGDGTFTYTPAADFNGADTFTYTVSDGTVSVERTMTVTVTPVNDAPVASNGSLTTNEDTAFGGTLPVASDVDGDALTYAAGGTAPSHGTVVVNGDGTFTYTPAADFNGADTFTYTVSDGTVSVERTMTVTVTPVNDAPVASNGSLTTNEDTAFGGTLPVATDVDGDALTYAAGGTAPSHGTVVVNGDGTFTYTPAVGYNGLDSFTYTVSDGTVSVERTMTVTVTPVNDAPVASNGSLTTNEDTAFGGTLPVASDVDGDALTYAAGGTAPSHGTVVVNGDGTFTYTPAADFNGADTFTYTVSDGTVSVERTMTVTVTPVNDAPVASNGSLTTNEDTAFGGTLPVASDVDGDALTYAAGGTAPSHGTVVVNGDGTFTYTPAADFNGADTFTYTVSDGTVSVERTMTVTVTPVNDAPVASNGSLTTNEDTAFGGTLPVASDVDGDALTYAAGGTAPSHGTVVVNGDGTFTYTPAADFNGADTFTYTVSDGTVSVERTMTVTVTPVNDAPVASNGSLTTNEDTAFGGTLPVASDVDGDALTYAAGGTAPSHGTVVVNGDGTFTYTPAADFNGADTFTYTVSDGTVSVERTMTVTVTPVNDAPVASNGSLTTNEDTAFGGTLPVASDVDGDALTYAAGGTAPSHGTVVVNGDGTFTYTPAADFNGADTFTYTVSDGTVSVERTMTVTVTPVNDAPVASNGSLTTNEDTAFGGTLPVASDVDGDALTYAAGGTAPSHGTVVVNGDGTFTYTPAADFNGADTFTYTVSDGTVSVERTMTVTVTPVNDAPVASNGSLTTNEDTAFGGTLPVASDVDGDALTYAAGGTAPSHGTVVVNGDGTFTYTPAADFNGADTFTYTVSDGTVSVERTMTVTVTPVNDAPVAAGGALSEGTAVDAAVLFTVSRSLDDYEIRLLTPNVDGDIAIDGIIVQVVNDLSGLASGVEIIGANGVVLDAVNNLSRLESEVNELATEGIVVETVERIRSLSEDLIQLNKIDGRPEKT